MTLAIGHTLSHAHILTAWLIFLASYLVFAIGRLPGTKIDRPAMAVIGAVAMFASGALGPREAIASIDFATLVLLFSMMLLAASLHLSGFFEWITRLAIEHLGPARLLPGVIFVSGILSAFLVNDIVCLVMAPLILGVCRRMRLRPVPYLLALATASNIGSTATITGNPQNIFIGSISGIAYRDFLAHLGPVALVGLFIDWAVLHWIHLRNGSEALSAPQHEEPPGKREPEIHPAWPVMVSLGVLIGFLAGYPPALVAAVGGALVLVQRQRSPKAIYGDVDWSLLMLFLGLFLVIGGAEQAGITGELLRAAKRLNLHNTVIFTAVVTLLSNIVSNVPAVMLLKGLVPQFSNAHTAWLTLAMSSTLAGNLTITGSVANIIVVEKARREAHIGFLEYMKIGVPVTVLTLAAGLLWLKLMHY
ncbi:MAG TPA: anion transporter [Candidatus Bathyarchaeia archaeon]|nr:anion transporter [Candidatus Bathyarchaeia archaeon]